MFLGSGTSTSDVLGLSLSKVGNEERSVILEESLLDLSLTGLVFIFLVIGNKGSAKSNSDSVDLRDVTTSSDSDSDVDIGKGLFSEQENWFEDLISQGGRLNQRQWLAVDSDGAISLGAVGNGSGVFLLTKSLDSLFEGHVLRFIILFIFRF